MRAGRIFAGVVVAVAAVTVAGCGGMGSAGSSNLGGAASIAPANSIAFVALDSDVSSGQWNAVDGLLRKFPAHDEVLTNLRAMFEKRTSLNWTNDVKPALGTELDLIALPGKAPQFVGLTTGGDRTKLDALLQTLDKGILTEQIGDWTAFSSSRAALDDVKSATTKLSDNNTYQAAVAKLTGDALLRAYANGTEAQQLLESLGTQSPDAAVVPFAWASAELVAAGDGVRVNGFSHDGSTQGTAPRFRRIPAAPYTSSLVDEIPSGAFFVADFPVTPGEFQFSPTGSVPKPLQKFFGTLPTLLSDLDTLLGGETAVYVRPGLPIPEVTVVTQPDDVTQAEAALADVLKTLRAAAAGSAKGGIDLSNIPVFHKAEGGQLIISTSQQGLADFTSAGPKLSADPSFTGAKHASGMPDQTTGFLYVNLATSLPLVQALGPMLGVKLPTGSQADLSAFKTLTAFGTRNGEDTTFSVFLEVR